MKNGLTGYNDIGRIDLFPNAFSDEEQLIRTVIHNEVPCKAIEKIRQRICTRSFATNGKASLSS